MGRLKQVSGLLEEHRATLADFLTRDPRGAQLPDYLSGARRRAAARAGVAEGEPGGDEPAPRAHPRHRPACSRPTPETRSSPRSAISPQLVEDALSIQLPALQRHGVTVTRELAALPQARLDKHKVLQILINLISNAKNAMDALPQGQRRLRVRLDAEGEHGAHPGGGQRHGHRRPSSASGSSRTASPRARTGTAWACTRARWRRRCMGGRLTLESEGPGKGATATLELPLA